MKFLTPLFFLLTSSITSVSVSASAIPHTKRLVVTPADLYQDITNIHVAVLANQVATENFQGGNVVTSLVEGVPVIATVGAIHVVNRKGFADATLSGPIDEANSRSIVQHTVDTVGNSIPSDIQTLIGKKSAFVASGQRDLVIAGLKLLLNDHDTFSAALLAKAYNGDPVLNAQADDVVARIHNAIQSGIDAYSS